MLSMLTIAASLIMAAYGWAEPAIDASGPGGFDSTTLAVVDGKPITVDIFKKEMARRQGVFDATTKQELLDTMVRSELLFATARTAGYENDLEVIATVKQVMVNKYLRDNLEPKLASVKATDQEAEAYYQAHQAEFGTQAMVHAALIRIAIPQKASEDKKAELLKRAKKARADALALGPGVPAFGSVAVSYSEDQDSRYRGGDIGWLQVGKIDTKWDRKVSDALFLLTTPGQITPLIIASDGYYIVKLMELKGADIKPFAVVKDGVVYHVIQEKRKQVERDLLEQLKKKISVTVNTGLLQTIALPEEGRTTGPPSLPAH